MSDGLAILGGYGQLLLLVGILVWLLARKAR